MIVLLIGPSGVGKSSALRRARRSLHDVGFTVLDRLVRVRGRTLKLIGPTEEADALRAAFNDDTRFLQFGIDAVDDLARRDEDRLQVVDVGAGFLDAPGMGEWLRRHRSIALIAPEQTVFTRICRARDERRTLAQFAAREFSSARLALYQQASVTIDASCDGADQLGERLVATLRTMRVP